MLFARMEGLAEEAEGLDSLFMLMLRMELIEGIFKKLDDTKIGWLSSNRVWKFAALTGFDGNEADWREEFRCICEDLKCPEAEGVNMTVFKQVVNDDEGGSYCSDEELAEIFAKLKDEKMKKTKPRKEERRRRMRNAKAVIRRYNRNDLWAKMEFKHEGYLSGLDARTTFDSNRPEYEDPDFEGIQQARRQEQKWRKKYN
mmetsp:Transcript_114933/g.287217  ORF Transcript_114933/g.287217 Transcript_114933/m.287217 type:complete len:200 (-) Transcript_114933:120-719(-)